MGFLKQFALLRSDCGKCVQQLLQSYLDFPYTLTHIKTKESLLVLVCLCHSHSVILQASNIALSTCFRVDYGLSKTVCTFEIGLLEVRLVVVAILPKFPVYFNTHKNERITFGIGLVVPLPFRHLSSQQHQIFNIGFNRLWAFQNRLHC